MSLYGNFICVDLTIPKVKMDELKEEPRSELNKEFGRECKATGGKFKW